MSAEGINDELAPLLRMTVPRGLDRLDLHGLGPGPLGRSWLLLFGLIPVDYDQLGLERIEPGRGFLERSTMLSQRLWEHERTIEPAGGRLHDRRPHRLGAATATARPAAAAADRRGLPPPPQAAAAPLRRRAPAG